MKCRHGDTKPQYGPEARIPPDLVDKFSQGKRALGFSGDIASFAIEAPEEYGAQDGNTGAEPCRRVPAVTDRHEWQEGGCDHGSERNRGLPKPCRYATFGGGEPAHDRPRAARLDRSIGAAEKCDAQKQRGQAVCECRRASHRERHAEHGNADDAALAVNVDGAAEREHRHDLNTVHDGHGQ
ncbi:hypothetical protein D3C86_1246250 [compost metagenome]